MNDGRVEAVFIAERSAGRVDTPSSVRVLPGQGVEGDRKFSEVPVERKGVDLTRPGVLRGLVHRGGLRADVLSGGAIALGDAVVDLELAEAAA